MFFRENELSVISHGDGEADHMGLLGEATGSRYKGSHVSALLIFN